MNLGEYFEQTKGTGILATADVDGNLLVKRPQDRLAVRV